MSYHDISRKVCAHENYTILLIEVILEAPFMIELIIMINHEFLITSI